MARSRNTTQHQTRPRVALYARISQDDSGEAHGVARQFDDLRALAKDRGWDVVAELSDNDVSAFSGARRPGYEQLLDLVRAGQVERVAVWHLSRLWRNRPQRMAGQDLFREHSIGIVAAKGPELDFSTATGRMLAELLSAIDAYESDLKGERVARATLQRVQAGRHSGDLGYGWTKSKSGEYVLDRAQAKVVREIVDRLIAGDTIRGITDDLNRRSVPAPGTGQQRGDGTWGKTSVRKVALRPSNAGYVVHRGEIIGTGQWPAIITPEQHEQVKDRLTRPDRTRGGNPTGSAARRHLLSWTPNAVCGICGSVLRVATKQGRYGQPQVLYVCDAKGCVGRKQGPVDDLVAAVVVERLRARDALIPLTDPEHSTAVELERLQALLDDAVEAFDRGEITATMLGRLEGRYRPQIDELTARARSVSAAAVTSPVVRALDYADPEAAWQALDVSDRLALVTALGLNVRILRGTPGPGFDPSTVEITWGAAA